MPPYGRGGAGNIQAIEQENARIAADLEANQSATDNALNDRLTSGISTQKEAQPCTHTGRGGAGNFVDSKDLRQEDISGHRSNADASGTVAGAKYGRGGAGNHEFIAALKEQEDAKQLEGEHITREQLKQEIERVVKESLAMPQKAKLAGGEPF
jgi:hypothetical protein